MTARVEIRLAQPNDAARIALLARQLGYPSTADQVLQRLNRVAGDSRHAVFVADSEESSAVGWLHVFVCHLVESDPCVEIGGLVVDERFRGSGVGSRLLEKAEAWARGQGCSTIRLRSNVIRKQAHEFYLHRGYAITKTQHAFCKAL